MHIPRSDEYHIAVQAPAFCFSDVELQKGVVKTNNLGLPIAFSGGFTTAYQIQNGNNTYAVRCFTREVHHLRERYQAIDSFIEAEDCDYLVDARYIAKGIKVEKEWYPIIKMKWIDGELLHTYIERHIESDPDVLQKLLDSFVALIKKMSKHHIAHGDLQHGNIIIKNDRIFLVDYDGVYLPDIAHIGTEETGLANYQHPKRNVRHFDEKIDRFSAIVIYLSLKALTIQPGLWRTFHTGENLLFTKEDFANPEQSNLLHVMTNIPELAEDVQYFASICKGNYDKIPALRTFIQGSGSYEKIEITGSQASSTSALSSEEFDVFSKLYGGSTTVTNANSGFTYVATAHNKNKKDVPKQQSASQYKSSGGATSTNKNDDGCIKGFLYVSIIFIILVVFAMIVDPSSPTTNSTGSSNNKVQNCDMYGVHTIKNTDGSCSCKSGYRLNDTKSQCISLAEYEHSLCKEKYGRFAIYQERNNDCGCILGYMMNEEKNKCITIDEYQDQRCKKEYGVLSEYIGVGGGKISCSTVFEKTVNLPVSSGRLRSLPSTTYGEIIREYPHGTRVRVHRVASQGWYSVSILDNFGNIINRGYMHISLF